MADRFDELVERYHQLVTSLIHRYYGGRLSEHAEDLSQDIWTKLWHGFKKNEKNIVSFKSYLYRTVQTTLWDAIRDLEKHDRTDALEEVIEPGVDTGEDQLHQRMRLQDLLHRLPAQEARMMRAHLKGFSNQEIAVLLDVSEGRVRNLLTRIRKKLTLMGGS